MCRDDCLKVQVKDVMMFALYAQTREREQMRERERED